MCPPNTDVTVSAIYKLDDGRTVPMKAGDICVQSQRWLLVVYREHHDRIGDLFRRAFLF